MWEGLARTERQDRVLHGAAKLANVFLGIILLPLWLFGQLIGGRVRDFLGGLERRGRSPLPVPPERERTMDALMAISRRFPSTCATPISPSCGAASPTSPISWSPSTARAR